MRASALFVLAYCSLFVSCHQVQECSGGAAIPSMVQRRGHAYESTAEKIRDLKRTDFVSEFLARVPGSSITIDKPIQGTPRRPNALRLVVVSFLADGALIEANFAFDVEDSLIDIFFARVSI